MTVREIVKEYLDKNGFDGLCCDACSCGLSDLMPCGRPSRVCEAGYFVKADECKMCNRPTSGFCLSPEKDDTWCVYE